MNGYDVFVFCSCVDVFLCVCCVCVTSFAEFRVSLCCNCPIIAVFTIIDVQRINDNGVYNAAGYYLYRC